MKAAYTKPFFTAALIILLDQIIKIWVRKHMFLGEEIHFLGNRGMLHYTENNGMAFGMELGGELGKLALTLFRIVAVCGIGYALVFLVKHKYHRGLVMMVALILAGALGNIIDSTFYGVIYNYAGIFHGRVVDMFYFPLLTGVFPAWVPIWGGEEYIFFRPVFNLADAAISVGVIMILLNQKRYFKQEEPEVSSPNSEMVEE
ncbi:MULTISPECIES: lipoprotein signal peptidase [unclassified Mucilaginibacter]|uniref:lipoprotein signal peptidase n=1 Tax=unclassified Mucilaginibacter TaxID=2617802 RepID=UPI002AC95518|nr:MULTISPECIES: lipoprotein signal peptidase [unclassified Mucilaginibacter]MEB0263624.1 lipoprotein signal peptidase [Mucilaginibacter sp. 10I4]MEB0278621.1 lipoprotein signal peptidase [Mucilaginibacter sp. 10B2]MEB0299331.1 lipoprotein signal peptidase [Mucilaginibacter sp. 5C4]WPX23425.1 lipoprotein signal peptidase [Mucilaginibacter sp. 5C4]